MQRDPVRNPPASAEGSVKAILTTKQAAAELGISEQRVRALIASGRLKAGKFGLRSHAIPQANLKALRSRRPGRPRKSA